MKLFTQFAVVALTAGFALTGMASQDAMSSGATSKLTCSDLNNNYIQSRMRRNDSDVQTLKKSCAGQSSDAKAMGHHKVVSDTFEHGHYHTK